MKRYSGRLSRHSSLIFTRYLDSGDILHLLSWLNAFQLSKKHHPDVSKDPKSKEIFAAMSAAYSVLNDDRERYASSTIRLAWTLWQNFLLTSRAYDKKIRQEHRPSSPHNHANAHPAANHNGEWSRRRPGATYAWARRQPPPPPRHTSSPNTARPSGHSSTQKDPSGYASASATHANVATDGGKSLFRRRTEALHREREKIEAVSSTLRALQVFLALVLISVFAAPSMGMTRYVACLLKAFLTLTGAVERLIYLQGNWTNGGQTRNPLQIQKKIQIQLFIQLSNQTEQESSSNINVPSITPDPLIDAFHIIPRIRMVTVKSSLLELQSQHLTCAAIS